MEIGVAAGEAERRAKEMLDYFRLQEELWDDSAGGGGGAGGRGGENRPGKWLNGRIENPGLTSSGDFSIMNNNHMV